MRSLAGGDGAAAHHFQIQLHETATLDHAVASAGNKQLGEDQEPVFVAAIAKDFDVADF